jgi:pentose-5-phosphate-3-epimerase
MNRGKVTDQNETHFIPAFFISLSVFETIKKKETFILCHIIIREPSD